MHGALWAEAEAKEELFVLAVSQKKRSIWNIGQDPNGCFPVYGSPVPATLEQVCTTKAMNELILSPYLMISSEDLVKSRLI